MKTMVKVQIHRTNNIHKEFIWKKTTPHMTFGMVRNQWTRSPHTLKAHKS